MLARNAGRFLALAYSLVLVIGSSLLVRRSGSILVSSLSSFCILWYNVEWMTLVANAHEAGENNRFRFVPDPLVLVFHAIMKAE